MGTAMYASGDEVVVHGGLGSNGQLNDMWAYSLVSETWS
jgi:hypothetical protein